MIEPRELRLGNWFINPEGKYEQVKLIEDYCVNTINDFCFQESHYYLAEDIQPIPITSKILRKCGFKKSKEIDNKGDQYTNGECLFSIEGYFIEDYYDGDQAQIGDVKSLHQFQNLYYAYTGQELDVKL